MSSDVAPDQPPASPPEGALDLDEQIQACREAVDADPAARTESLVSLLTARAIVLLRAERVADSTADLREACGLLRGYDGQEAPVSVGTARFAWASLAARERHEGDLDAALEAARRAGSYDEPFPPDQLDLYGGFYQDLKHLAADLENAGRPQDRADAAAVNVGWTRKLVEADPDRFPPALAIAAAGAAKAYAETGDLEQAVGYAQEALPILRERELGAIKVDLLQPLSTWLRALDRWENAVAVDEEALETVRARRSRFASLEVAILRSLAAGLRAAGRPEEARARLEEALDVVRSPGPGVVRVRETDETEAEIRADLAELP